MRPAIHEADFSNDSTGLIQNGKDELPPGHGTHCHLEQPSYQHEQEATWILLAEDDLASAVGAALGPGGEFLKCRCV